MSSMRFQTKFRSCQCQSCRWCYWAVCCTNLCQFCYWHQDSCRQYCTTRWFSSTIPNLTTSIWIWYTGSTSSFKTLTSEDGSSESTDDFIEVEDPNTNLNKRKFEDWIAGVWLLYTIVLLSVLTTLYREYWTLCCPKWFSNSGWCSKALTTESSLYWIGRWIVTDCLLPLVSGIKREFQVLVTDTIYRN